MGSYDRVPEGYDGPPPEHVIACNSKLYGQERHTHPTVELVKLCYAAARDEKAGRAVWPCSWLMQGRYDDGSTFTYECGLPTRFCDILQDSFYQCDGGHGYVPAQAAAAKAREN
jgi:hypothetical protein